MLYNLIFIGSSIFNTKFSLCNDFSHTFQICRSDINIYIFGARSKRVWVEYFKFKIIKVDMTLQDFNAHTIWNTFLLGIHFLRNYFICYLSRLCQKSNCFFLAKHDFLFLKILLNSFWPRIKVTYAMANPWSET